MTKSLSTSPSVLTSLCWDPPPLSHQGKPDPDTGVSRAPQAPTAQSTEFSLAARSPAAPTGLLLPARALLALGLSTGRAAPPALRPPPPRVNTPRLPDPRRHPLLAVLAVPCRCFGCTYHAEWSGFSSVSVWPDRTWSSLRTGTRTKCVRCSQVIPGMYTLFGT